MTSIRKPNRDAGPARVTERGTSTSYPHPDHAGLARKSRKYAGQEDQLADAREPTAGYVSARGGKWHRATRAEPDFTRYETAACGLTFWPLNVTWNGERPPTTAAHMCQRPGCKEEQS